MSSKFSRTAPAYVLPPWCLAPPLTPLPQIPFTPNYVQAEGRLVWPGPGDVWHDWVRSARDVPKAGATLYAQEVACGDEVLRFEINVNVATGLLSAGLLAYKGMIFQASTTWLNRPIPDAIYWQLLLEIGDTHIPPRAQGYLKIWV